MNPKELKEAVGIIAREKNVEIDIIAGILKDAVREKFSEHFNVPAHFITVEIPESFELQIFLVKETVDEVEDEYTEISSEDAKKIKEDAVIGDQIKISVPFDALGRKNIKQLMGMFMARMHNMHREVLFSEFKKKEGTIISGVFLRKSGNAIFLDLGKTEGIMLKKDQSPREIYKQGERLKAFIREVVLDEEGRLHIYLSRTDPGFIKCLFELEVPEVADGIIKIRKIVREPGQKIKMSVISSKSEVEPVGACVGMNGVRIKAVISEIAGEKIDVIPHYSNIKDFVSRAMQPAKIARVLIINEEEKEVLVIVDDTQYSLAIGRSGMNVRLASRLTGCKIDVKTEKQIEKHPEFLSIFSKAEELFSARPESDLYQLSEISEELLVRLMNAGIYNIYQLYEMNEKEISKIDGIGSDNAKTIKKILAEVVEVVDDEAELEKVKEDYAREFEDELKGVETKESIEEEIQEIEYLTCPSCNYEFKYENQTSCPKCGVEFEFEEAEETVHE